MNRREQPGIPQILAERKGLFVAVLAGFVGIVLLISWRMTPVYVAKTVFLLEKEGPEQKIAFVTAQNPFRPQSDLNGEYQQLRSRALADSVARRLLESQSAPASLREVVNNAPSPGEWLLKHTRIRPLEGSGVVEIRAYASDPAEAASMANAYAEVYVERSRERAQEEVRAVREFLADQVARVRTRLEGEETGLRDFQQRAGVASLPDETKALVDQLAQAENSHQHARADLLARQERLRLLREQLISSQEKLADRIPEVTAPVIGKLRDELADRMAYREKFLAQGYDPNHAKLRELEDQIGEIRSRLLDAFVTLQKDEGAPADPLSRVQGLTEEILKEEVEVCTLEARVQALAGAIQGYNKRLAMLPQKSFEMGQLAYNADVDQKILMMLQQRYEEARIEEAGLMGTAKVIDRAVAPTRPIRPDHRLNLCLALILGGVLAAFSCLVAHRLNRRIRNASEAERLSGWSVCGRIPPISVRDLREGSLSLKGRPFPRAFLRRRVRQLVASGGLAASFAPWSPVLDRYRALRVRICRMTSPAPQVILVTSPGTGDGKTMTACNLATVLAGGGSRVLLLEADMHRPQVASRLGVPAGPGLAGLLAGRCTLRAAIARTADDNLDLIPGGRGEEGVHDLLAGARMRALLKALRCHYDHVVVDSAPLIPVADATVLSVLADSTIVVVRCDHTECEALLHASQILHSLGIPACEIVFNADRRPVGGKRYYQYYRSHDHPARLTTSPSVPRLGAGRGSAQEEAEAA